MSPEMVIGDIFSMTQRHVGALNQAENHLTIPVMCRQVRELLGGHTLFGLVNNAGVAFHGPLMHQPISEFARNIEINLTGTLIVTQVKDCQTCRLRTIFPVIFLLVRGAPRMPLQLFLSKCMWLQVTLLT